jgi:hypothetical protein
MSQAPEVPHFCLGWRNGKESRKSTRACFGIPNFILVIERVLPAQSGKSSEVAVGGDPSATGVDDHRPERLSSLPGDAFPQAQGLIFDVEGGSQENMMR